MVPESLDCKADLIVKDKIKCSSQFQGAQFDFTRARAQHFRSVSESAAAPRVQVSETLETSPSFLFLFRGFGLGIICMHIHICK